MLQGIKLVLQVSTVEVLLTDTLTNKWTALITAAITKPNSLTSHRYSAFLHSCKWPATVEQLFSVQRVSSHLRTSTVVAAHLSTSST